MATEKGNGNGAAAAMPVPGVEAIRLLAEMGVKASEASLIVIENDADGFGLPERAPALFNRLTQGAVSVKPLLEEFRIRPAARTGTAQLQTLKSFIDLVNRHKDGDSAVFADMNWRSPKFTAVVDYHRLADALGIHEPAFLQHRLAYVFPLSEQWKAWIGSNGKPMDQGDFAAFIEDHIADLASPTVEECKELEPKFQTRIADPFEVMTLSRGLQVLSNSTVKQARNLQSGEAEIVFSEEHRDAAGNKLVVPGLFMLALPVFFRGQIVRLPVRLRYRPAGTNMLWFYQMWRADEFVTDAIRRDLDAVIVETGLPGFEGAPEA